jgi:hypothetical protein
LAVAELELARTHTARQDYREYIAFAKTIRDARMSGVSVGDYIDRTYNVAGATDATIEQMERLGAFDHEIRRICEIGPGSGRYLERVKRLCQPDHYEIYETAEDWGEWLVTTYGVIWRPTDGMSLAATPSATVDFVHCHKVLAGQPSLVIFNYLHEMWRIVRSGGVIAFDIVTEPCMDEETVRRWLETHCGYQHYPCLFPRSVAIECFERWGGCLRGSFLADMKPGLTEYFVFVRR